MGGADEAADAGVQSPAVAVMRTRFARCNSQADDTFMLKSERGGAGCIPADLLIEGRLATRANRE